MAELLVSFAPIEWLDIGVAMPFVLFGTSSGPNFTGFGDTSGFHVGELRLSLRGSFLQEEAIGLGLQLDVTTPTSDEGAFAGHGTGFAPKILLDFKIDRFHGAFNAGAYFRLDKAEIRPRFALTVAPWVTFEHELTAGLAGGVDIIEGLEILGEIYARTNLLNPFGEGEGTIMEAMGAVRWHPIPEIGVAVGGGGGNPLFTGMGNAPWRVFAEVRWQLITGSDEDDDGVPDSRDDCTGFPEDRDGFQDEDGCPDPDNDGDGVLDLDDPCPDEAEDVDGHEDDDGCPDPDNDGDGVLDVLDACPNDAEDRDAFEDADGCPDLDNDGDGVPDASDRCPDRAETVNDYEDEDGCPDFPGVRIADDRIETLEPIAWSRKGEIEPSSFATLRSLAQLILAHPEWERVRISSYTDSRGREAKQLARTRQRAESIYRFLVIEGVEFRRLEARGMGAADPIGDNRKRDGREKNNRIEIQALKSE